MIKFCRCINIKSYNRIILFIVFFIIFFLLNRFSPFINDDFYYAFIMEDGFGNSITHKPIESFNDILASQTWAYHNHNGRFIVHSLVQLFCSQNLISTFRILNSLLFIFLLIGICKIVRKNCLNNNLDIFITGLLLFLFIPMMGTSFLGNISCAINYLWTSCAIIWFIILWEFCIEKEIHSKLTLLLACIYSLFCGALQESFSIGISAALLLYCIINYYKVNKQTLFICILFVLGCCFVTFAPANFSRLASDESSGFEIMNYILRLVRVALSLRVFWILNLSLIILSFIKKHEILSFIRHNFVLITATNVNILFAIIIACTGKHQLVSIELFSIILLTKLILSYWRNELFKHYYLICISCCLILTLLYIPIYFYRQQIYNAYTIALNRAKAPYNQEIIAEEYEKLCTSSNWFIEHYARKDNFYKYNRVGLSLYITNGKDCNHISSVLPLSRDKIKEICTETNKTAEYIYKNSKHNFHVIRLPQDVILENTIIESFIEPGRIGKFIYSLLNIKNKGAAKTWHKSSAINCNRFQEDGFHYIIYSTSTPISDLRVKI